MQTMIVVLLTIIAICEVARLAITYLPSTKKSHFKNKYEGTKKMIYDLEFKIFKTREIREDIRQEYDYMLNRIDNFEKQIENFPKDGDQDEKGQIEDQKTLATRDANRLLAQIKGLDDEISGRKPTQEDPDGLMGITEQIDNLRELSTMLKDWIKSLGRG